MRVYRRVYAYVEFRDDYFDGFISFADQQQPHVILDNKGGYVRGPAAKRSRDHVDRAAKRLRFVNQCFRDPRLVTADEPDTG